MYSSNWLRRLCSGRLWFCIHFGQRISIGNHLKPVTFFRKYFFSISWSSERRERTQFVFIRLTKDYMAVDYVSGQSCIVFRSDLNTHAIARIFLIIICKKKYFRINFGQRNLICNQLKTVKFSSKSAIPIYYLLQYMCVPQTNSIRCVGGRICSKNYTALSWTMTYHNINFQVNRPSSSTIDCNHMCVQLKNSIGCVGGSISSKNFTALS